MEDAQSRRERLNALRQAKELLEENAEGAAASTPVVVPDAQPADEPVLKFRNYKVKDQKIEHSTVHPAQPPKFDEPKPEAEALNGELLQPDMLPILNGAVVDPGGKQDVLVNVAPKKANWDLQRDVQKKLEKLERRTQRAVVKLMQQQEAGIAAAPL